MATATIPTTLKAYRVEDAVDRLLTRHERDMGLTPAELAAALGVSQRTIGRWQAGETVPQRAARAELAELAELYQHLFRTFEDEAVPVWLRTPSRYLGGVMPVEMVRLGRLERVEAALEAIDSGFIV